MKLDGVVAFVAIADTGSISEAARRLRLSKSVVSERLAELERTLGSHLVQRGTRGLSLTQDGIAFRQRAVRITTEAAAATDELAERRGAMTGPLRIAAPRSLGDIHLCAPLFSFLERYPDIALTVDSDERFVDTTSGYDAIIRIAPFDDTKLAKQRLTISRRVLVAAPAYLDRHGAPRAIADLANHGAIHFMERSPDDWVFKVAGETVVSNVAPRLRVNSCTALRDAAIAGLGLALAPTFIVGEAIRGGALRMIDIGAAPDINLICISYHNGLRPSAKLRALIDHLKTAIGDPPYWDEGLGFSGAPNE